MNRRPIVAVRIILRNEDNSILLLKRAQTNYGEGAWCLPGGKVDYGQTLEEACANELKEETDLDIGEIELVACQDSLPKQEGDPHYLNLYFEAEYTGKIILNSESSAFQWVSRNDLDNYYIVFGNLDIIEQMFEQDISEV